MNANHMRANELSIDIESSAFSVTNGDLIKAIAEEVDFETVTNHELREIFSIVRKQLNRMNWTETVRYAVDHLPFGLNQTGIAWDGGYPCSECPDAMIDNNRCYHEGECKAWEIYEARL